MNVFTDYRYRLFLFFISIRACGVLFVNLTYVIPLRFLVHIWKKYRRIMTPILHPTNVEKFLPIFNEVSRQLVTNLSTAGKTVDPKRMIYNASVDAVTRKIRVCCSINIYLLLCIKAWKFTVGCCNNHSLFCHFHWFQIQKLRFEICLFNTVFQIQLKRL